MSEKTRGAKSPTILRRALLTAAVLIVAALFMAPVAAETMTGVCGKPLEDTTEFTNAVTWSFNTDTGELIISGNGAMANLQMDDTETPDIDEDNRPWKMYRPEIKSVTITKDVTHIGNNAFYNCTNLASISLPDSLLSIGHSAFRECKVLESINLPDSLTSIGQYTFRDCIKLSTVEFSATPSLDSIGASAFRGCIALESIILPDSLTSIGGITFMGCTSLTTVVYPDSLTSIGSMTFNGCTALTSVTLPTSLKSIDVSTFNGCTSLKNIILPNSITSIGNSAFQNCNSLESIVLPDFVQSIGSRAFINCDALKSITLPGSLKSIGEFAFDDCDSLASINLPDSLQSIGEHAFHKCYSLTFVKFPSSLESVGNSALQLAHIDVIDLTHMAPDITIGSNAFTQITTTTNKPLIIYKNASTDNVVTVQPTPGVAYAITNGGKFEVREAYTNDGTLATPKRDRYAFLQWYKIEDENEIVVTEVESGKTYYAKWTYDVTFDGNGATSGSIGSVTGIAEGETATLPENGFARNDYVFAGWNTKADGTGTAYAVGDSDVFNGHTTLYAQWTKEVLGGNDEDGKPITYTINAIVNQTYSGKSITPNVIVKEGATTLTKDKDYSVSYSQNTVNVGKVTVTVTITKAESDVSTTIDFWILQDKQPVVYLTPENVDYDGKEHGLEAKAETSSGHEIVDAEISITYYEDEACTTAITGLPVVAKTYWAKATLSGTPNYVTAVSDVAELKISDAEIKSSADGYTGTYNGKPQSITVTVTDPADALVEYSENGIDYSTENPQYTDAGIYTVYYRITKENYETKSDSITVTIAQAQPVLTITPDPSNLVGGGEVTFTIEGVPEGETVTVSYDDGTITPTEGVYTVELPNKEKTYTFTVEYAGNNNYKAAEAECKVTVSEVKVTVANKPEGSTVETDEPVSTEDKGKLTEAMNGDYKKQFGGKPHIFVEVSLFDAAGNPDSTPITFIVGYGAFGIDPSKYGNYNFVVLHLKNGAFEVVPAKPTADGLEITSSCSPFAIAYSEKPKETDTGSSTPQGSSVWLTETPTPTDPAQPSEPEQVPTDIPTTQPTTEPESPGFGVLAVLGGLGAVAVLRRK